MRVVPKGVEAASAYTHCYRDMANTQKAWIDGIQQRAQQALPLDVLHSEACSKQPKNVASIPTVPVSQESYGHFIRRDESAGMSDLGAATA
jgi:hypothetical protein